MQMMIQFKGISQKSGPDIPTNFSFLPRLTICFAMFQGYQIYSFQWPQTLLYHQQQDWQSFITCDFQVD